MGVGEMFLTEDNEDAKLVSWGGVKVEDAEGKASGFNGTLKGLGRRDKEVIWQVDWSRLFRGSL